MGPRQLVNRLRLTKDSFALMADADSRRRLAAFKLRSRVPATQDPVCLRLAPSGGTRFFVRPGTTDFNTLMLVFLDDHHMPPSRGDSDPRQICELGSNIGAGLVALASRFPRARIVGVEPDPANAALARRNVEPFGARCRVIETAVWDSDAELVVEGDRATGYTVRQLEPGDSRDRAVRARTVDAVLAEAFPEGPIDYLRLAIEGTEPRILAGGHGWAERVRSIRSELHPHHGFEAGDCVALFEALGFEAWAEPENWGGFAFGVRP